MRGEGGRDTALIGPIHVMAEEAHWVTRVALLHFRKLSELGEVQRKEHWAGSCRLA